MAELNKDAEIVRLNKALDGEADVTRLRMAVVRLEHRVANLQQSECALRAENAKHVQEADNRASAAGHKLLSLQIDAAPMKAEIDSLKAERDLTMTNLGLWIKRALTAEKERDEAKREYAIKSAVCDEMSKRISVDDEYYKKESDALHKIMGDLEQRNRKLQLSVHDLRAERAVKEVEKPFSYIDHKPRGSITTLERSLDASRAEVAYLKEAISNDGWRKRAIIAEREVAQLQDLVSVLRKPSDWAKRCCEAESRLAVEREYARQTEKLRILELDPTRVQEARDLMATIEHQKGERDNYDKRLAAVERAVSQININAWRKPTVPQVVCLGIDVAFESAKASEIEEKLYKAVEGAAIVLESNLAKTCYPLRYSLMIEMSPGALTYAIRLEVRPDTELFNDKVWAKMEVK